MSQSQRTWSWIKSAFVWLSEIIPTSRIERWFNRLLQSEVSEEETRQGSQKTVELSSEEANTSHSTFSSRQANQEDDAHSESSSVLATIDQPEHLYDLNILPQTTSQTSLADSTAETNFSSRENHDEYVNPLLLSASADEQTELNDFSETSLQVDQKTAQSEFEQDPFGQSFYPSFENENFQTAKTSSTKGAIRVKLRDEERERRRALRRKKRRQNRDRQRRQNENEEALQHAERATHDLTSGKQPTVLQEQNTLTRTEHKRPPLRSKSRWSQLGYSNLSQWQRYSPSSKALLFGSWFASLDSLVEVHQSMLADQNQFYQLVAEHEEFSTFSPTELDAWWFQLNRVDHFITEYQFYKKLQKPSLREQALIDTQQELEKLQTQYIDEMPEYHREELTPEPKLTIQDLELDLPIQVYEIDQPVFDGQDEPQAYEKSLDSLSLDPTRDSHSMDDYHSYENSIQSSHSLEEDIILRPIKRRKRRSSHSKTTP